MSPPVLTFQDEVRAAQGAGGGDGAGDADVNDDVVQPEPLDMSFPRSGFQKQISYILLFPLIFPLWLTLPDTRGARGKSWDSPTKLVSVFSPTI